VHASSLFELTVLANCAYHFSNAANKAFIDVAGILYADGGIDIRDSLAGGTTK
jgi:hypothetical protein